MCVCVCVGVCVCGWVAGDTVPVAALPYVYVAPSNTAAHVVGTGIAAGDTLVAVNDVVIAPLGDCVSACVSISISISIYIYIYIYI